MLPQLHLQSLTACQNEFTEDKDIVNISALFAPINSRLNVVVQAYRLGWVEMAFSLLKGPSYPDIPFTQTIFSPCCHLNNRRRAAHRLFKIDRLFQFLLPHKY